MPYDQTIVKAFAPHLTKTVPLTNHILAGDPPVPVILRRSSQVKRISLRISSLDGRVTLTMPSSVPDYEALDFAESKRAWILTHLSQQQPQVIVRSGAMIPVEGVTRRAEIYSGRAVRIEYGVIQVPQHRPAGPTLRAALKERARDRLIAATDYFAARLGRRVTRITLRDTRSRWGSCTSTGGLMFSWRLILSPPDVLRYVAAHEVAHLAEMNHSPAYWRVLSDLHGPFETQRTWLKTHGADLHRYIFDD